MFSRDENLIPASKTFLSSPDQVNGNELRKHYLANKCILASHKWAPPKVAGIVLCSAFGLEAVLIAVGNLLTIALFAVNRNLRKKNLLRIVNMAFADLMLGTVSLPMNKFLVGGEFKLQQSLG